MGAAAPEAVVAAVAAAVGKRARELGGVAALGLAAAVQQPQRLLLHLHFQLGGEFRQPGVEDDVLADGDELPGEHQGHHAQEPHDQKAVVHVEHQEDTQRHEGAVDGDGLPEGRWRLLVPGARVGIGARADGQQGGQGHQVVAGQPADIDVATGGVVARLRQVRVKTIGEGRYHEGRAQEQQGKR
ncbi:MAG: hypothetical protein HYY03_03870 [Chloroflexi bacterium]|nr:hypothetical protein [Chloroflexota bacterium]